MKNLFTLLVLSMVCFGHSYAQSNPQICLVSVDLNSLYNIVYWEKAGMDDIAYYKIYRQNSFGTFVVIDSVDNDSLSEYHDLTFDPNLGNTRYKISGVDTLGVESALSLYHGTIFCDEPTSGFFDWVDYEIEGSPSPVVKYIMLRKDTIGALWLPVDSVLGSVTDFTDPVAATFPDGEWRVRTLWPVLCNPSKAGVSTSRSNIRNRSMLSTTPISNEIIFAIYPNPSNNIIHLRFINNESKKIAIYDLTGKQIEFFDSCNDYFTINLAKFDNGLYYIDVIINDQRTIKPIVKY